MNAIVLSCDKYHPLTEHMINSYEYHWPSNSLTYRVPWNDKYPKNLIDKFKSKIHLINTPTEFKPTIDGLLKGLEDRDWIFWSTDDTYLDTINEKTANKVFKFVSSIQDTNVDGITFGYIRQVPFNVNKNNYITYDGLKFLKRTNLTNQWAPQFWRVEILKKMFECLDEAPKHKAKEMDYMLGENNPFWDYIKTKNFYTLDHRIATWGESTHRGKITQNCVESFKKYELKFPSEFKKVSKTIYFR